jgi:cell division protein FtsW (lipid II flippase)
MERRSRLSGKQPRYSGNLVRRHKPDHWLLIIAALLLTIGLVVVYSISPALSASQHVSQSYFITKQLIDIGLGILVFAIASYLPLNIWPKSAKPLAIAAIVGSLIVMVTPIDAVYQAHRWIRLGGYSFQVAELIKLAILVGLAQFLARQARAGKLADFNTTLRPLIFLLLAIGVVVAKFQSDLGSAGVLQAYGYLPEASNDSIFAIMAEKFGFIGTVFILAIYGAFIGRLKRIAERVPDHFQRLVIIGVMTWLSIQMIINVGAMTGLLPLKGITLPLISQGGTSLIFLAAALGIVFQISRYTSYSVIEPNIEVDEANISNDSFNGRGVRRPHNPSLVARPRT